MKKNILIITFSIISICAATVGYMKASSSTAIDADCSTLVFNDSGAWGPTLFLDQTDTQFFYDVSSRFARSISKKDLHNAKTVADILLTEITDVADSFDSTFIHVLTDDRMTDNFAVGVGETLSTAQVKLLAKVDYSNNIRVRVDYSTAGTSVSNSFTPYYTVVPENETIYTNGREALITYLKENSRKHITNVKEDDLQPGKIYFVITKDGEISNVNLNSTCGYSSIDETMIKLIREITGSWKPASNSKGKSIDQTLVFSYGTIGC